jgi:phosphatidylcholine synthase
MPSRPLALSQAFLALVAVLKNDPFTAFIWLGVALFVDGVDGSLARKARVTEYTPNFDGRLA